MLQKVENKATTSAAETQDASRATTEAEDEAISSSLVSLAKSTPKGAAECLELTHVVQHDEGRLSGQQRVALALRSGASVEDIRESAEVVRAIQRKRVQVRY